MAVQQSKVSKQKCRSRKGANRYEGIQSSPCPSCGAPRLPHRVCDACGMYKGRQVKTIKTAATE
jgi:large subunit ribosomal protein L32